MESRLSFIHLMSSLTRATFILAEKFNSRMSEFEEPKTVDKLAKCVELAENNSLDPFTRQ